MLEMKKCKVMIKTDDEEVKTSMVLFKKEWTAMLIDAEKTQTDNGTWYLLDAQIVCISN